ncbi:MAG: TatD family hydrolase [Candidatus Micrarchaeota archaeon]|nr:TatD family hydrolase [Candidatus Micrarchaeota archaeon]
MQSKQILKEKERETQQRTKVEMADSHTHLDLFQDLAQVDSAISYGVSTIITCGVDTKTNFRSLELQDGRHIFAALGVDPEHLSGMGKDEIDFNMKLIRERRGQIVAIGEVGLDYKITSEKEEIAKQKSAFSGFLKLAKELDLPVCIHSREAMSDTMEMVEESGAKKVMFHFFSGDEHEAMRAASKGYMISIPPMESSKRRRVIKAVPIDNLLVETDSPVASATPRDVERAIRMVCEAKGLAFDKTAERLTLNTKRFFNIRSPLMRI